MKESLLQLGKILKSKLLDSNIEFNDISIDSRNIKDKNLFIAIKGEKFDGHEFISEAINNGCSAIITEKKIDNIPQLIVTDTTLALAKIAKYWIQKNKIKSVAITGTNGKTTVKELTGTILNTYKKTLLNIGNYNNEIGLPLTVFKLDDTYKIGVFEMGASKKGDIKYLIDIVEPSIVALLNVSPAHIEGFKNFNNLMLTKEEIFLHQGFDKTVVLNIDDQNFDRWSKIDERHRIVTISEHKKADYCISNRNGNIISFLTPKGIINLNIKNYNTHLLINILFSIACSMEAGAECGNVIEGYKKFEGIKGRFYPIEGINNSVIIDDTYNANPSSVKTSISMLISMKGSSWLIIGDMGELGKDAKKHHYEIGQYAYESGIEKLFCIGKYSSIVANGFGKEASVFKTKEQLIECVKKNLNPNTNVLVKASRFMKFESIVDELVSRKD